MHYKSNPLSIKLLIIMITEQEKKSRRDMRRKIAFMLLILHQLTAALKSCRNDSDCGQHGFCRPTDSTCDCELNYKWSQFNGSCILKLKCYHQLDCDLQREFCDQNQFCKCSELYKNIRSKCVDKNYCDYEW